jgi:hypothetical protein
MNSLDEGFNIAKVFRRISEHVFYAIAAEPRVK